MERQRGVFLFLSFKGYLENNGTGDFTKRVLHFAPERSLFSVLSNNGQNKSYRGFDVAPERYEFAGNLMTRHDLGDIAATRKLPVADIIVHNHVLEHVPANFVETIEVLNSLLAPGGVHVFSIPIRKGKFDEDLSPSLTGEERTRRFDQEDHMRIFGTDDVIRTMQSILQTNNVVFRLNEHISPKLAVAYGLAQGYKIDRANAAYSGSIFYYVKPAR